MAADQNRVWQRPTHVTYHCIAARCHILLLRKLGAYMPDERALLQRCLSHAGQFCYKLEAYNGRPNHTTMTISLDLAQSRTGRGKDQRAAKT